MKRLGWIVFGILSVIATIGCVMALVGAGIDGEGLGNDTFKKGMLIWLGAGLPGVVLANKLYEKEVSSGESND